MKKRVMQLPKHTLDLDPGNHIAAGVMDSSATVGADDDQDLAQLVWKYFGDEIRDALREAQEALATE